MRREDDAAGMSRPMQNVERRIVLGQIGIAAIAENRFHKIEIADEAARREEANLHRFIRIGAGGGTDQRP